MKMSSEQYKTTKVEKTAELYNIFHTLARDGLPNPGKARYKSLLFLVVALYMR